MATISITVPADKVAEVSAAIQFAMNLAAPATATDFKAFVRKHVKAAVLKYRESQQADIDHSDPTQD